MDKLKLSDPFVPFSSPSGCADVPSRASACTPTLTLKQLSASSSREIKPLVVMRARRVETPRGRWNGECSSRALSSLPLPGGGWAQTCTLS